MAQKKARKKSPAKAKKAAKRPAKKAGKRLVAKAGKKRAPVRAARPRKTPESLPAPPPTPVVLAVVEEAIIAEASEPAAELPVEPPFPIES
jgi:hypothetical protein